MILNTKEIADSLFLNDAATKLSVIPQPDESEFRKQSGASVDLRLGRWFRTMRQANLPLIKLGEPEKDTSFSKEHFVSFDGTFILHPGKFALGITLEWIALPGNLAGHITGKSSLGRRGLIIETAAGIQPGFAGCLTLELANVGEIPIQLTPGMQICQIFLHQASSINLEANSQYKGARKPGLGAIT